MWDYTVTNLMRTNVAALQGERMPFTTNLGPVILTISGVKIDADDFRIEHQFHLNDGSAARGWKLLDQQLTDSRGADVAKYGVCREGKGVIFRCQAARNGKTAPHEWNLKFQELPGPGKFLALDVRTNLAGAESRLLGIAGTGRTVFRLPIPPGDRSPSTSDDDFDVELDSNRAMMKAKSRIAIVEAPAKFNGSVIYVRGLGRLEKQHELEIDANTRLFFIPLNSLEKEGQVELAFRADETIPVELAIDPSTKFQIATGNAQK
jgi:hypothetical protein